MKYFKRQEQDIKLLLQGSSFFSSHDKCLLALDTNVLYFTILILELVVLLLFKYSASHVRYVELYKNFRAVLLFRFPDI